MEPKNMNGFCELTQEETMEIDGGAWKTIDDTLVDDLILIGEKRNIIVHNQGVVNYDFIKKFKLNTS